jgi:hypothetical protein
VADLNADGQPDLATANASSGDVSVLLGRGDGTFQEQRRFAVGDDPGSLVVADLNADGRPDLATANAASDDVSVLLGRGDGTFQEQRRFAAGLGLVSLVWRTSTSTAASTWPPPIPLPVMSVWG